MRNFVLSYNPFAASPTSGQVDNHARYNRLVSQFYQPFPGTCLLKSDASLGELNDSFSGLFEASLYMIMVINPELSNGRLPQEIWAWIGQGSIPVAPPIFRLPPNV